MGDVTMTPSIFKHSQRAELIGISSAFFTTNVALVAPSADSRMCVRAL